ncbi:MAG: NfeD family protein [Jatrophihabitans sp.]|nr:MAG: NfeD family protein [Jatrophihabitans sp.]
MPAWLIWLIVAAGLAGAETLSLDLVLLMCAGGAGAGAITAAFGAPLAAQVVVALVVAAAMLGVVRPVAKRHLVPAHPAITGTDALVGEEAVALARVDHREGRIRLHGGEWSARTLDPDESVAAGTVVRVVLIDGATAVVTSVPAG